MSSTYGQKKNDSPLQASCILHKRRIFPVPVLVVSSCITSRLYEATGVLELVVSSCSTSRLYEATGVLELVVSSCITSRLYEATGVLELVVSSYSDSRLYEAKCTYVTLLFSNKAQFVTCGFCLHQSLVLYLLAQGPGR